MSEIYDLAILGAGPAGITAAIYALRGKMNILWIDEKFATGGQITDTSEIDNYPGMPGVTGMDLGEAMGEHARRIGAEPVREKVRSLENLDQEIRTIRTKKHEYQARAVILALGAAHRKLMIPGEEELSGMGVSYCATCDGAFYKDRVVAVTGGGDVALEDAAFLARLCKKVYIIHRRDVFRGTKVLQDKIFRCENVEVIWDSVAEEILGESEVRRLCYQHSRCFCSRGYKDKAAETGCNGCGRWCLCSVISHEISGWIRITEVKNGNDQGNCRAGRGKYNNGFQCDTWKNQESFSG